jgi:hypothetical protein
LLLGGGRLATVYFCRKHSFSGILSGVTASVQSSSMGKKIRLFSRYFSLCSAHHRMNSGQFLSQLACVLVLHDIQWILSVVLQLRVWCLPLQVPQVSDASKQAATMWPHFLHFMHWIGSCLSFVGNILVPQMCIPSLISLLAVVAEEIESVACASLWS